MQSEARKTKHDMDQMEDRAMEVSEGRLFWRLRRVASKRRDLNQLRRW